MLPRLIVALVLLVVSAGAWGADLTIVAPGCASWSLSGATLTCSASGTTVPPPVVTPPPVVVTPPPTSSIACAGFVSTQVVDAKWPASNVTVRSFSAGFGDRTALVVRFTTGLKGGFGRITAAEYGSAPTLKTANLSTRPCDFAGGDLGMYAFSAGMTVTSNFSVGLNTWGYPELAANTTYYFNIKNEANGVGTCAGSCDVFVDLKAP
jgi:hypothetical protein